MLELISQSIRNKPMNQPFSKLGKPCIEKTLLLVQHSHLSDEGMPLPSVCVCVSVYNHKTVTVYDIYTQHTN